MSILAWMLSLIIILAVIVRLAFAKEIRACFERDPAARNLFEVLLTYSGLHAIICFRIAHAIDRLKVPVMPRLIMTFVRWLTGIESTRYAKADNVFCSMDNRL